MQSLKIGQVITAVATFTNTDTNTSLPLAAPAKWSVDDATKVSIAMQADGTTDGISTCQVTGLAAGPFNLTCVGEGDATPGVDTLTGNEPGTVLGPEDNAVTMGWSTNPTEAPAPAAAQ